MLVKELDKIARASCASCARKAAFQLCLCIQYAFGCPRNDAIAQQWFTQSRRTTEELNHLKDSAKYYTATYRTYHGTVRKDAALAQTTSDYDQHYAVAQITSHALKFLRMEISGKVGLTDGPAILSYFLMQDNLASLLTFLGKHDEAVEIRREILTFRDWELGDTDRSRQGFLNSKSKLAVALWNQKILSSRTEALEMQREVVTDARSMFGDTSSETRSAQSTLLRMLTLHPELESEAKTIYETLLTDTIKVCGPTHRTVAKLQNQYAVLLYQNGRRINDRGKVEQAVSIQKDAHKTSLHAWGSQDLATVTIVNNLNQMFAELSVQQQDLDRVVDQNRTVLEQRQSLLGLDHTLTLQATKNLVLSLQDRHNPVDLAEAASLNESIIKARQSMHLTRPLDHRHTLDTITVMDEVASYFDEHCPERLEDAARYRRLVTDSYQQCSADEPGFEKQMQAYKTARVETLILLSKHQRKTVKSNSIATQDKPLAEAFDIAFNDASLDTASVSLIHAHLSIAKSVSAASSLHCTNSAIAKALQLISKYRGQKNISVLRQIARVLTRHWCYSDAIVIRQDILDTAQKSPNEAYPPEKAAVALIDLLSDHADVLLNEGDHKQAMSIYQECVRLSESNLNPFHYLFFASEQNIAKTHFRMGNHDIAIQMERSIVDSAVKTLGEDDDISFDLRRSLALMLKFAARYDEAVQLRRDILEDRRLKYGATDPRTLQDMAELASSLTLAAEGTIDMLQDLCAQLGDANLIEALDILRKMGDTAARQSFLLEQCIDLRQSSLTIVADAVPLDEEEVGVAMARLGDSIYKQSKLLRIQSDLFMKGRKLFSKRENSSREVKDTEDGGSSTRHSVFSDRRSKPYENTSGDEEGNKSEEEVGDDSEHDINREI